ncbi:MAG: hypothetical protein ACI4K9_03265 [Candidatus Fimenecus sp.]
MAKKPKVELTLEELQAKKSKRQRGWVRFCAILLAVVLTAGIYGMASSGDPTVVEVYPNVVRAQTKTIVQKQDAEPTAPAATDDEDETSTAAPSTSEEESSILDTLMGLLSGLDLSSLAGNLNLDGLGITIAGGIQTAKDSLLTLIDQLEAAISGKPSIAHEAVEYDFDESVDRGDEAARNLLVEALNNATQADVGYTVTHTANYADGGNVSIGAQTETVNQILAVAGLSLDSVVGEFAGMHLDEETGELIPTTTFSVAKGQTVEEAVEASDNLDAKCVNYGLMPTQLTAEDIAILEARPLEGYYVFQIKNVDNPNRRADCGLTRLTNDYLVQHEVAQQIQNAVSITEVTSNPLKLTDLDAKYTGIQVTVQLNPLTGRLESMDIAYTMYGKFTVRTNAVQVVGAATMVISDSYSDFVY